MVALSEQTLLVTGANGFIGQNIIKQALDRGYNVRGTVRSAQLADKVQTIFADYGSKFTAVVVTDLSKKELYEPAFANTSKPITGVIHVASPFKVVIPDVTADILDPAIKGTIGALEAARQYGPNVRRFVLTSSFTALVDLSQGLRPGYTYTEKDWNPMTREQAIQIGGAAAYCASKALAAAWDWVEAEKPFFTLASINSPTTIGPHVTPIADLAKLNTSSALLWLLADAKEVPPTDFVGFADVRVVAAAHLEAFERPEAAGERFLVAQHFDWQSAVDALRETLPHLQSRLPVGTPGAGKVENVYRLDGSKAERILGIKYIPLEVSVKDSFEQFLQAEKK
jgi:NADPH-dependent methylglyoxal reductase